MVVPNGDSILQKIYLSQRRATIVEIKEPEKVMEKQKYSSWIIGLIVGILCGGIILAPILTLYLTSPGQYFIYFKGREREQQNLIESF